MIFDVRDMDMGTTNGEVHKALHSGLERPKSDIKLGFTQISNIRHFYIMAFESLTNLLQA